MKHRIICIILSVLLAASFLTACGEVGGESGHALRVRDDYRSDSMTVVFRNTDTGKTLEAELKKTGSGDGYTEFSYSADPAEYDRVLINGGVDAPELAYNEWVSGWELSSKRCYPCIGSEQIPEQKTERKTFEYQNRTKDVVIWTPEDYDPDGEKYSVIYMTDGQNLFQRIATSTGSWGAAESALAMAAQGGEKCIIVGVENPGGWRDDELTPNIGEVQSAGYEDGHGIYFSDFVVDTVMPYINENYNVYTDREHTHICGSSSGGIECFYIAMTHPDRFASVGALSPAFILFSDETWIETLKAYDYSQYAPLVYIYCGNSKADSLEQVLYQGSVTMPDDLRAIGYPEDKVVLKLYDDGIHNEMYWRAVFPDYLKYAFPKTEPAV